MSTTKIVLIVTFFWLFVVLFLIGQAFPALVMTLAVLAPLGMLLTTMVYMAYWLLWRRKKPMRIAEDVMEAIRPPNGKIGASFATGYILRWQDAGRDVFTEIVIGPNRRVVVWRNAAGSLFTMIHVYTSGDRSATTVSLKMVGAREPRYAFWLDGECLGIGCGPDLDIRLGYVLLGIPLLGRLADSYVPPRAVNKILCCLKEGA